MDHKLQCYHESGGMQVMRKEKKRCEDNSSSFRFRRHTCCMYIRPRPRNKFMTARIAIHLQILSHRRVHIVCESRTSKTMQVK